MVLGVLLEIISIVAFCYLGITQLVLPLWRGTPVLPFFRRERRLQRSLVEATGKVEEAKIENEIAKTNRRAKTLRRSVRNTTQTHEPDEFNEL